MHTNLFFKIEEAVRYLIKLERPWIRASVLPNRILATTLVRNREGMQNRSRVRPLGPSGLIEAISLVKSGLVALITK